jgi:hypothetical protein
MTRNQTSLLLLALAVCAFVFGITANEVQKASRPIRCAQYQERAAQFDNCVKNKSCAMAANRFDEWGDFVAFQSNTYDCDK